MSDEQLPHPTTSEIEDGYAYNEWDTVPRDEESPRRERFRSWHAAELRKAKAEALREAAQQAPFPADPYGGFDHESLRAAKIQIGNWLRDRADRIEGE